MRRIKSDSRKTRRPNTQGTMRQLKPDSRGIFVPRAPQIQMAGHINQYDRPSTVLARIDRIRAGKVPRVCVTRKQGGIGDVLMTLPTVKAISLRYKSKIDYGTDFGYLDGALVKVLQDNPYIEKVIPWRDATSEVYDAVVDLTCPCVFHEKPLAEPINRIDLFARHAGVKLHDFNIDYQISESEEKWAREYIASNSLDRFKIIMVNMASSTATRDAPADKMQRALANVVSLRRDVRILLISHESDSVKISWDYADVHQFVNFDVRHIAAIMPHCEVVVCPDSAILHVAAALHMPTVTLFGPTDPRARVNYHPEAVAIWPGKELRNYPCWYTDPGDGFLCWKRLEEDVIVRTILAVMDRKPLPSSRDLVTFGSYTMDNEYYEVL